MARKRWVEVSFVDGERELVLENEERERLSELARLFGWAVVWTYRQSSPQTSVAGMTDESGAADRGVDRGGRVVALAATQHADRFARRVPGRQRSPALLRTPEAPQRDEASAPTLDELGPPIEDEKVEPEIEADDEVIGRGRVDAEPAHGPRSRATVARVARSDVQRR